MNVNEVNSIMEPFGLQTGQEEALFLFNLVSELSPKTIVEIGVSYGGSLLLWSKLLGKDGLLIGVDAYSLLKWNVSETMCKTIFVEGNSMDPATLNTVVRNLGGRTIDFLRIDGGHDFVTVKNDFEKYSTLVSPGGVIALHDYVSSSDVGRFSDGLGGRKVYENSAYVIK